MTELLDNPIWHALAGPQAAWAVRRGAAARFLPEAAPFFGLEDLSERSFRDLAELVRTAPGTPLILPRHAPAASGLEARLYLPHPMPAPPGWRKTFEKPLGQMLMCGAPAVRSIGDAVVALGPDDRDEILALARRTEPGPFGARTPELGQFLGIRRDGRLVAMAGERLRMDGFVEISAVATGPEHRGCGYGSALVGALASRILAAGALPFLHVYPDNPAVGLYRSLGFRERRSLVVTWLQLVD